MRHRNPITVSQRKSLRSYARANPDASQAVIQKWFEDAFHFRISQSTISTSLSKRYASMDRTSEILREGQRLRKGVYPELEQALYLWVIEVQADVPVSGFLLRTQALEFWAAMYPNDARPRFSNGWLEGFKKRFKITSRKRHGEAGSVDIAAITEELEEVKALAQQYDKADIYNCDETGLFWKNTPDRGYGTIDVSGKKKVAARLTAHFCVNADGSDFLKPWIIGKFAHPHCFGPRALSYTPPGCIYRSNANAWMTTPIMMEWMQAFDRHVGDDRNVLLIMDNFSAHKAAVELLAKTDALQNTRVCFLPPNSTAKTQPLDMGAILSFKMLYRKSWAKYMVEEKKNGFNPLKTVTIRKAIQWSIEAWNLVPKDIVNMCWRKSGLFSPPVISNSETFLDTLPDTSDESETNVASDDASPDDEALEMVRNILRDKELSELIFKQFPQPHISSPRAIAKYIDPPEEEIRERDAKSLVAKIASQFTPQVSLEEELQEMSEEPIIHVIPSIPHTEALTSLKSLREYIGEREISQGNVLAELERIEETILRSRQANVRQRPIQDFFAS